MGQVSAFCCVKGSPPDPPLLPQAAVRYRDGLTCVALGTTSPPEARVGVGAILGQLFPGGHTERVNLTGSRGGIL